MSVPAILAEGLRIGLGLALHLGICISLLAFGAGLPGRVSAWLAGQRSAAAALAPLHGWLALWRKRPARAEPAGALVLVSLWGSLLAAATALLLTPGFARLWPAPVAPDPLTLMGLLIVSRLACLLPGFAAGIAADALPAQAALAGTLRDLALAEMLAFAVAQAAGGSHPGSLTGLARPGGPATLPLALACVIAAAVLLAVSERAAPQAEAQLSGPDLALARLAGATRLLGWLALVALLLPPAPAPIPGWSSLALWPLAIAIWLVKLAVALLALMLAAAPGLADALSGLRRQGACLLFCVLAVLLMFISGRIA